jgi:Tfp pilus assembly protein PilW
MPRLTPRTARLAGWIAIPVALLTSGLVISQASYSAFSSVASNPASNWTAGSVAIADDDAGSALFTATALKPGSTGTKCITVTSSGSLASLVKLYGVGSTTTNGLSSFITLTVTQGTGGNFGSCTGFTPLATGSAVFSGTLAAFGTTATNYATGLGTWAPTGASPETRVYRLTYTVDAAAPNTSQNGTAAIAFTWEAQNS